MKKIPREEAEAERRRAQHRSNVIFHGDLARRASVLASLRFASLRFADPRVKPRTEISHKRYRRRAINAEPRSIAAAKSRQMGQSNGGRALEYARFIH